MCYDLRIVTLICARIVISDVDDNYTMYECSSLYTGTIIE